MSDLGQRIENLLTLTSSEFSGHWLAGAQKSPLNGRSVKKNGRTRHRERERGTWDSYLDGVPDETMAPAGQAACTRKHNAKRSLNDRRVEKSVRIGDETKAQSTVQAHLYECLPASRFSPSSAPPDLLRILSLLHFTPPPVP